MPATPPGRPFLRPGVAAAMLFAGIGHLTAHAQLAPTDFVTVGSPGNRPATPAELAERTDLTYGSVPYSFRITRTEVTTSQVAGFFNAYAPISGWTDYELAAAIFRLNWTPARGFFSPPGSENLPASLPLPMAFRYCNWLTNDQRMDLAALESGAYDMAQIVQDPIGGQLFGPPTHLPTARYWLPSIDEWAKAMYYDPHKNGPGIDGYWRYPTSSDAPPRPGLPGEPGAQTNAGVSDPNLPFVMPVGSYPDARSPWGLLDGSGSEREWTETAYEVPWHQRYVPGSGIGSDQYTVEDHVGFFGLNVTQNGRYGFRIVSDIPSPDLLGMLLLSTGCFGWKRSQRRYS